MGGRFSTKHTGYLVAAARCRLGNKNIDVVCADGSDIPVVMNVRRQQRNGTWNHKDALFMARDSTARKWSPSMYNIV